MSGLRFNRTLAEGAPSAVEAGQAAPAGVRAIPGTQPSPVFFHFDLRRSLQMHRPLAVSIFGLITLLALAYVAKTWNNFFAECIVYVQPSPPKLMDNGPTNRWPYDATTYESYMQQQIHDVTRPDVLLNAAKRIPNWAFSGETPQAAAERLSRKLKVDRIGAGY